MKINILNRLLERAESFPESKTTYLNVHSYFVEKFFGKKPLIKDLQDILRTLNYSVEDNLEAHLKIQTFFELINNSELELKG
jgi:hypothetical protein